MGLNMDGDIADEVNEEFKRQKAVVRRAALEVADDMAATLSADKNLIAVAELELRLRRRGNFSDEELAYADTVARQRWSDKGIAIIVTGSEEEEWLTNEQLGRPR